MGSGVTEEGFSEGRDEGWGGEVFVTGEAEEGRVDNDEPRLKSEG